MLTLDDNKKLISDQQQLAVKNETITQLMKAFEGSKSSDSSVHLYKQTYQQLDDEFKKFKDSAFTTQRELIENGVERG